MLEESIRMGETQTVLGSELELVGAALALGAEAVPEWSAQERELVAAVNPPRPARRVLGRPGNHYRIRWKAAGYHRFQTHRGIRQVARRSRTPARHTPAVDGYLVVDGEPRRPAALVLPRHTAPLHALQAVRISG